MEVLVTRISQHEVAHAYPYCLINPRFPQTYDRCNIWKFLNAFWDEVMKTQLDIGDNPYFVIDDS